MIVSGLVKWELKTWDLRKQAFTYESWWCVAFEEFEEMVKHGTQIGVDMMNNC